MDNARVGFEAGVLGVLGAVFVATLTCIEIVSLLLAGAIAGYCFARCRGSVPHGGQLAREQSTQTPVERPIDINSSGTGRRRARRTQPCDDASATDRHDSETQRLVAELKLKRKDFLRALAAHLGLEISGTKTDLAQRVVFGARERLLTLTQIEHIHALEKQILRAAPPSAWSSRAEASLWIAEAKSQAELG